MIGSFMSIILVMKDAMLKCKEVVLPLKMVINLLKRARDSMLQLNAFILVRLVILPHVSPAKMGTHLTMVNAALAFLATLIVQFVWQDRKET